MINLLEVTVSNPESISGYPFCTPLFEQGFHIRFSKNITFIVGENGVGKSTLLESIALKVGFPLTGGTAAEATSYSNISRAIRYSQGTFDMGDLALTFDEKMESMKGGEYAMDDLRLEKNIRMTWRIKTCRGMFVRSETFIAIVGKGKYGTSNMSHGEGIIRVLESIKDDGLYIFDEPEAGLSPSKCLEFLSIMQQKADDWNAQFIISTHSPIFITYPNSELFQLTETSMEPVNYAETSHYQLSKRILSDPKGFFEHFEKLKSL